VGARCFFFSYAPLVSVLVFRKEASEASMCTRFVQSLLEYFNPYVSRVFFRALSDCFVYLQISVEILVCAFNRELEERRGK